MENRLSEAARTGNVGALQKLLQENPLILADFALTSPYENPLHIATKARQLVFVREIIKHNPEFASESNQDGFRPMDMASTFGYVEIVTELLGAGPEICRLSGRDGKTALHYAAINGRVMVIDQLLSTCGASIKDVTALGETALHLAVKFCKFEAFKCLIRWIEQLHMEEMVNWHDRDGNTVLHISVSRKQLESVELLLNSSNIISRSLELNAMNSSSLTAMDIMDIVTEGPSDIQLREVLQSAGALKACNINGISITTSLQQFTTNNNRTNQELLPLQEPSKDWFKYFKFQQQRDSPSDARNTLLVVAALIATVTFQAVFAITPTESVKFRYFFFATAVPFAMPHALLTGSIMVEALNPSLLKKFPILLKATLVSIRIKISEHQHSTSIAAAKTNADQHRASSQQTTKNQMQTSPYQIHSTKRHPSDTVHQHTP
ncbi:Ankyrin repeat-containing protein BDA1 [Camellia lanceoleosa]|uniref:Ankyrin repeat-containing protein BDA1 n=1 Tax=Camellia lanceoleosa TaxID=1840588 RepID=A0ACC0IDW4_9ERIC|nr:Ankyrin repeat-containing protein BDA1 [Camellia lanceoleosa]